MRMLFINLSEKENRQRPSRRLRSAAATLCAVAFVLMLAVVFRRDEAPAAAVSASGAEHTVYAMSYCGTADSTLELMKNDIEYLRGLGLEFILPRGIAALRTDAVILIVENAERSDAALELLDACSVPAVIVPAGDLDPAVKAELLRREDEGGLELAAYVGSVDGPWELAASVGEASIDFVSRFGRPCSTFVHECRGIVCSSCFDGAETLIRDMTVFTFGNGKNEIGAGEKPLLLNRIMRLPDWTIEAYFSEIAN